MSELPRKQCLGPKMEARIKIQYLCTNHLGHTTLSKQNKKKCPLFYFFLVNWIYWGDTCQQYTDFKCTILQHVICILYGVFTTPSQLSIHHHLSLLYLPLSPPYNHHTIICVHEFSFIFSISPPPTTSYTDVSLLSITIYAL